MIIYDDTWLYMWIYVIISDYIWLYAIIYDYIWLYMIIYDYRLLYMIIYGYRWLYMIIMNSCLEWYINPYPIDVGAIPVFLGQRLMFVNVNPGFC